MRRKEMHINADAVAAIAPASPSSSSSTATNKKSIHVEYAIIYIEMAVFIEKQHIWCVGGRPNSSITLIHPTSTAHINDICSQTHFFAIFLATASSSEGRICTHPHGIFYMHRVSMWIFSVWVKTCSIPLLHDDECNPNSCWITAGSDRRAMSGEMKA